jgi:hypothetical protein
MKFYVFNVHFLLLHKIKHQQMHYIYEATLSYYIISHYPTGFDVYTSSSGVFSTMVFTGIICCTVDFEQTSKNHVSTTQLVISLGLCGNSTGKRSMYFVDFTSSKKLKTLKI